MNTIRVIQLGAVDLRNVMQVSDCAEWYYEPNIEDLPKGDLDVAILNREITAEEFDFLMERIRAHCLFVPENLEMSKGTRIRRLFRCKAGKVLSEQELNRLLAEDLPDYFSRSYGEKFIPGNLSIAQGFRGSVIWKGFQGVELVGVYGEDWSQIVFWRNNIPIAEGQSLEFWLEYEKDEEIEISLKIVCYPIGSVSDILHVWTFSERDLDKIVRIERVPRSGSLFFSLNARREG